MSNEAALRSQDVLAGGRAPGTLHGGEPNPDNQPGPCRGRPAVSYLQGETDYRESIVDADGAEEGLPPSLIVATGGPICRAHDESVRNGPQVGRLISGVFKEPVEQDPAVGPQGLGDGAV